MTKKQLYFIIAILLLVLLVMLFIPSKPKDVVQAPEDIEVSGEENVVPVQEESLPEDATSVAVEETLPEQVILEGTFLSLAKGTTEYEKEFVYLLLNDDVEVLRIDLRPLVGYSQQNITQKLGVERGDVVRVTGGMTEGAFTIESIEAI